MINRSEPSALKDKLQILYHEAPNEAASQEIFQILSLTTMDQIKEKWDVFNERMERENPKLLYYISTEFLIGRVLGNMLIYLCQEKQVREVLEEKGFDLNEMEDQDVEILLGKDRRGRFAACVMDSLATLGYPAYGCGIRYEYGFMRQKIVDGCQVAYPDEWLKNGNPFEVCRPELAKIVTVEDVTVKAVPYDIPILGYHNEIVNTIRLWKAEPTKEIDLQAPLDENWQDTVAHISTAEHMSDFLYSSERKLAGKEFCMKQQYFLISATVQDALCRYKECNQDIRKLHEKVVFHLNETSTVMTVLELIRILIDEEKLGWEESWDITKSTCVFTLHTNEENAFEQWPVDRFSRLFPRLYSILEMVNEQFLAVVRTCFSDDMEKVNAMSILRDGEVRMVNLAAAVCYSVNGVSEIHTEQLKNQILPDFYEMMPEKFSCKTNGVTQRRFLLHANPLLSEWLTSYIGDGWITRPEELEKLKGFVKNSKAQREFLEIKYQNKCRLAQYILAHHGIEVNPNSIFDVQAQWIKGDKRHLLNLLHVMYLYDKMKTHPDHDFYPRTFIFGGKADMEKWDFVSRNAIRMIHKVAEKINHDESIHGKLKVVFLENYNVSLAELLCSAADVSEQIAPAGKEASGTGCMKFMMNGALLLGTMGGANVEIVNAVGMENVFMFGLSREEIEALDQGESYCPKEYYEQDRDIQRILQQSLNDGYFHDMKDMFDALSHYLLTGKSVQEKPDPSYILADFQSYIRAQERLETAYRDRGRWAEMALVHIAASGRFSCDCTVRQYAEEIWNL